MGIVDLRRDIAGGKHDSKFRKFLYSSLIFVCIILLGAALLQENLTSGARILIITVVIPLFALFAIGVTEFYIYFLKRIAQKSVSKQG